MSDEIRADEAEVEGHAFAGKNAEAVPEAAAEAVPEKADDATPDVEGHSFHDSHIESNIESNID